MSTAKVNTNSDTANRFSWINRDVENNFKHSSFHQMQELEHFLRRMRIPMAIFGLVFVHREDGNGHREENKNPTLIATVYNLFILCCLWLSLLHHILARFWGETSPEQPVLGISLCIWSAEVAMNATIMLKATHPRVGNLSKACDIWTNKVMPLMDQLNLDMNVHQIRKHLTKALIVGWSFVICNLLVFTFIFFYPNTNYYEEIPALFISPFPINVFTRPLGLLVIAFYTTAWILPGLHLVALNTILTTTFKSCCKALQVTNKDKSNKNVYPGDLYRERSLHLNMCKIVQLFDKDLRYLYASICGTHITLACFMLFHLFKSPMDVYGIVSYVFWLAASLLLLVVSCLYAANMNEAAHSPLDCIYETGTKGISLDQIGQVNFYLSKLTAAPIGFTVMNFFVITREFILTVGGIFLTYSFVLLQF